MIEVSGLVKVYGTNLALDNISFTANEREIVGFLGPNGAGKSTCMNIMTGYLSSNAGTVKIGGVDISEKPDEAKKMIGFLPEQPPVYGDMTVIEYLDFVYDLKGCKYNRKKHLDECGQPTQKTQTAYLLALKMGMFEENEREAAIKALRLGLQMAPTGRPG